jgi:hypothetical protein
VFVLPQIALTAEEEIFRAIFGKTEMLYFLIMLLASRQAHYKYSKIYY